MKITQRSFLVVMTSIITTMCIFHPIWGSAQRGTILTNADIVKLSSLDLPPSAVISKIKNSKTHFDVSVEALVELKKNNVHGDVISEMITASSHEQAVVDGQKDMNDPKTMRKAGIYYYNKSDPTNLFIPIDATGVSATKTGGLGTRLAQSYTYGIVKNKYVSSLSGAHAHREIPHSKPKFYFYLSNSNVGSPNDFALVKLKEKRNAREMTIASENSFGASIGIDDKEKIDFNYELIADGIYKVYAKEPMDIGEYCFVYIGAVPGIFSGYRVYDFSIPDISK